MRKGWIIGGVAAVALVGSAAAFVSHRSAPPPAARTPQHRLVFALPEEKAGDPTQLAAVAARMPRDADVWARLGNARLRKRAFAAAADAYRKALAIDPERAETWSALGEAYIQSERATSASMPAAAKEAFARARALDPGDLRARFYQAMEHDFAGRHDLAVGQWLQMLREAPMGSDADEAIRAALGWSVNRNLSLIKAELSRATAAQPQAGREAEGVTP
ncbi:tetratricopeptide repeat protein [Sphingomonas sp.]|jgi:cytochrome c-type biogenesis protein CcmH|uniref:tetratricopeptide repeat protein n=1 Tax=Sphingomonas sp. TaxID=28214 RepID=UPI0035C78D52